MNQAVIVAAKRTAFGKYGGTLKHLEPEQLLKPLFQHFKEKYPEASLETESFLSAASFQETTRVLTDAAIKG
ncbi:hypothetical protein JVV55_18430, partial [Vibrio cholerae O1]|nr:hypothetical protein [Vibrio cholerae O1]